MRSQRMFEDYPGCPRVPVPVPESMMDAGALARLGVANTPLARGVTRAAFVLSGFARFHRTLAARFDEVASRSGGVAARSALPLAAVQALADAPEMQGDPLRRAACLLAACWDLHAELREGRFEPDRHGGRPLESRLYLNLFGTSIAFDGSGFRLHKTENVSRIAVLARGRTYVVDFDDSASPPVEVLVAALAEVRERSRSEQVEPDGAMGFLPCAMGPTQTEAFRILLKDPGNQASYELLKDTFVTLCLDLESAPRDEGEAAAAAFSGNSANRWFHASLQVVVFGNARAATVQNFAIVPSGSGMARAAAELYRRSAALARGKSATAASAPYAVKELSWNRAGIPFEVAVAETSRILDDQPATFDLTTVGRTELQARGLRPVETFVAAVQHAAFRLTGRCPSVGQLVSLSAFSCGTVTVAQVGTREMAALQTELGSPDPDPAGLRALFLTGVDSQRAACREVRSHFPLMNALRLYREGLRGTRRTYVDRVFSAMWLLLRRRKLMVPQRASDILLSHPAAYPEVPVIGRPGVRVPSCNLFGLHYTILDERIRITVMPAMRWTVPNADLAAQLESSLAEICSRLGAPAAAGAPTQGG